MNEELHVQEGGIPPEQQADEARLEAIIQEGQPAAPGEPAQAVQTENYDTAQQNISGLFQLAGEKAKEKGMLRTSGVLTVEKCDVIGQRFVPVLQGFPIGKSILDFFNSDGKGPAFALFMSLYPLYSAAKADLAELNNQQQATKPGGDGVSGD